MPSSLQYLLNKWRSDITIGGNFTVWKVMPPKIAKFEKLPEDIHPIFASALKKSGIDNLYSHQLETWILTRSRCNPVVVTGTASGKTLCYNLPVIDHLLKHPESKALYLFPTKALAQDQLAILESLITIIHSENERISSLSPIHPATYDGDTPSGIRAKIRQSSRLILSNPDMLNTSILPHHTNWENFFRGLQFIVLDEIHTYRGVFGSHVSNIIRRLRRIAKIYGSSLHFIMTSATIGNPTLLAEKLIEEPVVLVDRDGCARGEKHFLIYNPPLIDPDLGLRAPLLQEAVRLTEDVLAAQIQTIIFGRSRRIVEILLTYLRSKVSHAKQDAWDQDRTIRAYRSGYLPQKRREIEKGLRIGMVQGVIATTALELGIDIGGLDASIMVGYPGTISGTWQQAGRAGRGRNPSLAVLIAASGPLDQFISKNPDYIFSQHPEEARINPDNLLILFDHLKCAAYEQPFTKGEHYGNLDASQTAELLDLLTNSGFLHKSGNKYFWMSAGFPAADISLRNVSADRYTLQDPGSPTTTIGEVDGESAFWMVHPQAIYMHEGETYIVQDLDINNHIAFLQPITVDYYTRARQESEVKILTREEGREIAVGQIGHGDVSITTQVVGYTKIRWETHEKLSYHDLDLPPTELFTTGYWFMFNIKVVEELRQRGLWSNDPNDYGPSWKDRRDSARARDNFICQVCGIPETDVLHHVHHITPFRAFDTAIQANALSNLITLCPTCHNRVEAGVQIRSGLAGMAYLLWNLTPLLLMCDVHDIGIHQDPKSPLNDNLPIIVIYDSIPGGLGFSQFLYEKHGELYNNAYNIAVTCECKDGCPSCVGPGGEFGTGGKKETLALLEFLTGKTSL